MMYGSGHGISTNRKLEEFFTWAHSKVPLFLFSVGRLDSISLGSRVSPRPVFLRKASFAVQWRKNIFFLIRSFFTNIFLCSRLVKTFFAT